MRLDGKPIPGWAEPYVDWMVGQDWPEGDEERCFRLADACVAAAHRIVTKTEAGPVMSDEKTGRTWDGAAHAAFAEHVAGAVGGREAELVVRLVGTAIAINDAGVRVRNARHTIEATVRLAVAQLGHLLAAAMTGDASTLALVSARLRLARLTVAHIGERTLNDIALSTAVTGDAVPAGGLALAGQDHRDALDARRPAASTLAELADHVTAADDVITEERSAAERHIGGEAPGVPDTDGRYLAPFLYPGLMYTGLMGGGPYGGATSPSRSPAGRRAAAVPSSPDHPTGRSAPAVPPWPGSASSAALTTDRRSSAGRSSTAAASSSAPTRSSAASARDTTPGHASAPSTARPFFGLDLDLIRRSVSAPAVTPGASRSGRPRRTPRPVPHTGPEARQPAETEPRPGAATGAEPAAEAGSGSGSGSGSGAGTGTGTEAQGMAAQGTAEATASDPSYNKVQEALTPAADEATASVPPGGSAPAKPSASTSVSPAPEPSSTSEVPSPGPSSASGAPSLEPSAAGPSARESPASGSPAPKRPRVRWKRRR
ncbi:WXG100-like domain-containing protein [Streptosporangium sandarakinum]|uniref:WXG100-like domain-containing protein n=1 Tax=Streptosporangium sandarakinum TaxID=1260955 RepID=UPI00378EC79A